MVTSAARMTASTRRMTGTSGAGRAVRSAAAIAAAMTTAVARRTVVAAVTTGRPWLDDGLPHVELWTRSSAALVIART